MHDGHVVKQISEALGLLAGAVGAVYLLGAIVLALRLQTHDLPTLAVLSNLPRELVISFGLTYAVVPWLLTAAAVAVFWFLREEAPRARSSARPVSVTEAARALILTAVAVTVAWLALRQLDGSFGAWDAVALSLTVLLLTLLANAVWRVLANRYADKWTRPVAIGVAAALTGLVVVPAFVEIGARAPLADAQLCVDRGVHLKGWLVGEAGDRVYLGENVDPHRIVSAPLSGELYVGPEATEADICRADRATPATDRR